MVPRLLLAALLVAGCASAQGKKGGGGSKGGDMGDMSMARTRQSKIDTIAEKLKLTKEQKDEVIKIFDNAQEKTTPLNEQLRGERNKVTQLMIAGKNSGEDWDAEMKAFTTVLSQQESIETEAYQKLYATLDDKQKPKAAPVFEELMAGMFTGRDWKRGGGGGMGMGGDRGGR